MRGLLLCTNHSKTLSSLCNPLTSSLLVKPKAPFHDLSKRSFFCPKMVTPMMQSMIGKHPLLKPQKNRFFWGTGAAELQNHGSYHCGRRDFSYLKVLNSKKLVSLQRNQSLFDTRKIHVDASTVSDGLSASRVSRTVRTAAQTALFQYLHSTRGLHFTDAEHMSKNSPIFLQNLLEKIDNDEDIGRSITRFLRYHPINEFEPFFESLGLNPSELHPLLPRSLMFLSDDDVLLENYHAFCNYGVPRSKIGKMYKEATEVFRYDYGVILSKLQAYENLGLSKPTIIKLVMCCPELLVGDLNVEFRRVLEKLEGLGIELDWIRGCFSDKSIYNWNRILELLNFLDRMGCTQKDFARLIKEHPRFVFDESGKKIYILVAFLLKLGLGMNTIFSLLRYPQVLLGNFMKNFVSSINFLFRIGMKIEDVSTIISSHPQVLGFCCCKEPETVLRKLNLSAEALSEIVKQDPNQLRILASKKKTNIEILPKMDGIFLREKTDFLLKLGFVENSDEMAKALRMFRGRGDQLQERFDCLVNAGLDCHMVSEMVRSVPQVLNQSMDVIEKKIDYLVNLLGYPLESLATFPTYLCYSMEKTKLRFSMHIWLKEQGVTIATKNRSRKMVASTVALSTILACSDARFVKYVVSLHPEGPEEWRRLKECYLQAKGQ